MIDKRCRVRIYVQEEAVYMSLRGQVCARVIATPSYNNAPGQCRDSLCLLYTFKRYLGSRDIIIVRLKTKNFIIF